MMVTINDAKEVTSSIAKALQPIAVILFGFLDKEGIGVCLDLLIVTDLNGINTNEDRIL